MRIHLDTVGLDVVLRQFCDDCRGQFPAGVCDAVLGGVRAQKCGALHPQLLEGGGDDRREAFGASAATAAVAGAAPVDQRDGRRRRRRGGGGRDGSDAGVRHAGNVNVRGHPIAEDLAGTEKIEKIYNSSFIYMKHAEI